MMSLRWSVLPANRTLRAIRPALAVGALGAFLAITIVSGRSADARLTAAHLGRVVSSPATDAGARVPVPDVVGALQVLGSPGRSAMSDLRASRSLVRTPVHIWVRPYGGVFSSPFGYRWGRLHAGIDLAGPWGTTIVAATDGCISYAGPMSGYGEVMQIRDWDGTETVYGHMSSFVRTSGCVRAGEPIARIGSGGDATGPHLHFEVRVGGVPVDPVPFLAKRGVSV
jgi:murein DD-endopeptidase MepM/ murein hydrolase activator NlpD